MEYAAFITATLVMAYIVHRQQRVIDQMSEKLMARDYREYVSMQPKPQETERKKRKPLSFYDDPDLDPEFEIEDTH